MFFDDAVSWHDKHRCLQHEVLLSCNDAVTALLNSRRTLRILTSCVLEILLLGSRLMQPAGSQASLQGECGHGQLIVHSSPVAAKHTSRLRNRQSDFQAFIGIEQCRLPDSRRTACAQEVQATA
jgi:hypothetical protein